MMTILEIIVCCLCLSALSLAAEIRPEYWSCPRHSGQTRYLKSQSIPEPGESGKLLVADGRHVNIGESGVRV